VAGVEAARRARPGAGRHRGVPRRIPGRTALVAICGVAMLTGAGLFVATTAPAMAPRDVGGAEESDRSVQSSILTAPPTTRATLPPSPRPSPSKPTNAPVPKRNPVPIPFSGSGDFEVVDETEPEVTESQLHYTVEIERGLPFGSLSTGERIREILDDERGWVAIRGSTFRAVDSNPELRILLATPATTDALCAPLETSGRVSCRNGELVVINARRWAFGTSDYRGFLQDYRRYVVNHEVGHALGEGHVDCPMEGAPAPVMMQQTYGLAGCRRNPWPSVS